LTIRVALKAGGDDALWWRVIVEDFSIEGLQPTDRPFFSAKRIALWLDWTTALGEEYGGVNQEDREFEGAKQFVQLAADTVKNAVAAPPGADPRAVAGSAFVKAAQTIAPGLLQAGSAAPAAAHAGNVGQSGVWYRRGKQIVLQGA
jgi:hypothetical protein